MKSRPLKSYLRYSNRERRSFFYLVILLLGLAGLYFVVHFHTGQPAYVLQSLIPTDHPSPGQDSFVSSAQTHPVQLRRFNPNTVDLPYLIKMGIPPKAAQNWIKYTKKGGRFKDMDGIARIYGMTPDWCNMLSPYLEFEKKSIAEPVVVEHNPMVSRKILTPFDPNTAGLEEFTASGIPERTARVILNFRAKGGQFKQPGDLKKIYGISDSLYRVIAPYLIIQSVVQPVISEPHSVDINRADTSGWKKLPGIGSVLARRIVGFRDILGGFISPDQLKDVYGLKDSTLQVIRPYLVLSPIHKKIRINLDLPLNRPHPYLSVKDSRVIGNFIQQNGEITSPDQLGRILAFDSTFWQKLLPYLSFETVVIH